MLTVCLMRQDHGGLEPDRAFAAPEGVETGKRGTDRLHVKRAAVDLEHDGVEHSSE